MEISPVHEQIWFREFVFSKLATLMVFSDEVTRAVFAPPSESQPAQTGIQTQ
jgi:hypothetical protein